MTDILFAIWFIVLGLFLVFLVFGSVYYFSRGIGVHMEERYRLDNKIRRIKDESRKY